jgi:hypothetical protein
MPKVKDAYLSERIRKRIAELEAGDEVPVKDIRAVLTQTQLADIDSAWTEQQLLRKGKRARTEQEQQALGWRTKRDIRLLVLRQALKEADSGVLRSLQDEQSKAEIRQARIYFEATGKKLDEGYKPAQARMFANNELTRAGLNRMDGAHVHSLTRRDKEVRELEVKLKAEFKMNMTAEELEQQQILEEHEANFKRSKKKQRKVLK